MKLPDEVSEKVRWYFQFSTPPNGSVFYYPKAEFYRGDAWEQCKADAGTADLRKCHSENYWIWCAR